MPLYAIGLVLLSAVFHALWNYVAKRAQGGPLFVWMFCLIEIILYLPLVILVLVNERPTLTLLQLAFIMGSAVLHLTYYVLLTKGYQVGDLSVVYPLARAIGPLIATVVAIVLLGERPTPLAFVGGLLICGGVFWLTGDPRKLHTRDALPGVRFAIYTGIAIAGYTLWDAYAMSFLLIAPLLFEWSSAAFRMLYLTPYALRHWPQVQTMWQRDKGKAAFVAIFSPLAYILVLVALTISPVSYVAPLRVISTLIGVGIGVGLLREGHGLRRLSAAAVMVAGTIALSLG